MLLGEVFLFLGEKSVAVRDFSKSVVGKISWSQEISSEPPVGASGGINSLVFDAGTAVFATVAGSPFQQWAVMCPHTETAKEGNEYLNGLADQWKEILKELKKED